MEFYAKQSLELGP